MNHLTLHASSLASKYGFEDGEIISNYFLYSTNYKDVVINWHDTSDSNECLYQLVKHYLLPLLPNVTIYKMKSTCHNPVRTEDIEKVSELDISIDISEEELISHIKKYCKLFKIIE
jgi:hypothetical protein